MPLRKRAWLGMGGVALASAALVFGAGRLMADGEAPPGCGRGSRGAGAPGHVSEDRAWQPAQVHGRRGEARR